MQNKSTASNHSSILKQIVNLQKNQPFKKDLFFCEGVRNFVQLVDNNFKIETIIYSEKLLTSALARKMVRQLRRKGVPTVNVSPESFRQFSTTHKASGVGAVARQSWFELNQIQTDNRKWIVIGEITSPGNFGTLIRSSEAFGFKGFIILDKRTSPYSSTALRSSMGGVFNQKFIRTDIHSLEKWLVKRRIKMAGASPEGESECHSFNFTKSRLIMLGEERKGLTDDQKKCCDDLVRIPMSGQADSLNLGVAGSLFMYEAMKRKF